MGAFSEYVSSTRDQGHHDNRIEAIVIAPDMYRGYHSELVRLVFPGTEVITSGAVTLDWAIEPRAGRREYVFPIFPLC